MTTREPSVTPRNEAAERLRQRLMVGTGIITPSELDAALRTERQEGYLAGLAERALRLRAGSHEPVIYATNTEDGYLRCRCGWPDPIEEGHFTEHFEVAGLTGEEPSE